jgi:rhamnogalacturonan endolyase
LIPKRTPFIGGRRVRRAVAAALVEALEERWLLSFGLTTTSTTYTVDTGAGLVFSVLIGGTVTSTLHLGDLTSAVYNGTQTLAPYSLSGRYSHYEEGLSSATTFTATVDPNNQWILIACNDTGSTGAGVIQYYLARNGYNTIYMASYAPGPNSPSPGEMRFITYTNPSVFTNIPAASNNSGGTAIESSDVFGHPDGTTSSKYYGEYRAIDTQTYGDTGSGIGVFMNIGNRETSSGGPFAKDIDFQNNELYTYVFSGHSQTENFRPGLKGFYALEYTNGTTPAAPDYSFIDTLGAGKYVTGYTGSSGRGTLVGKASGVPSSLQETVGLSNAADQYWASPNTTTGAYTISGILPGTYTETIYQGELAAGTQTVTIAAGQTTACNITDTLYTPPAANTVFRIGTWDGTPLGFLNSNLITYMHPTDVRMSPWATDSTGLTNFIVGTTPDSSWPMAEWHGETSAAPYVDTDNRITFTLTAAQAATLQTFRIGLTRLDSARPNITVNSNWSSAIQGIATEPNSRGLTTGNWRGNNVTYSFNIPAGKLVAGTNTIDIYSVSGSTGTLYSGYHIYDALDLVNTSSITNAPAVKTIILSPANPTVQVTANQIFTAQAYDQFGNAIAANFSWSAAVGSIDQAGNYTATITGSDTITATANSVSATTNVIVPLPAWLSPTSIATWNSVTRVLTVTGASTIIADPGSALPLINANGSSAVLTMNPTGATQIHIGGLTLTNGAKAIVATPTLHANRYLLILGSLSISSALLDLGGNDLDLSNASGTALGTTALLLTQGYNLGNWSGTSGIISSKASGDASHLTTLGMIQNNQSGTALYTASKTFDLLVPGVSDILIKYTYFGDANLDGKVDGTDYSRIDNGYLHQLTSWFNGDFNYSQNIDGSDYTLIDNAFNSQSTSLAEVAASTALPAIFASPASQIRLSGGSATSTVATKTALALLANTPVNTRTTGLTAGGLFSAMRIDASAGALQQLPEMYSATHPVSPPHLHLRKARERGQLFSWNALSD